MKEHSALLSPLEAEFLKASRNVKKRERLNWIAIAGVGAALLLVIVLAMTGKLNRYTYRPVDMEDYWITIPAGEFQMGSENGNDDEKPVHNVYIDDFQMGIYEVTNRQYYQCVKAGICSALTNKIYTTQEYELHPVTDVSWYEARTFCEWVGGRLPTEAEWEKAARGTDSRTYPWGEGLDCGKANYGGCVGDTSPVDNYPGGQSPYGIFNMAGNVWEWVSDFYSETYYAKSPAENPQGSEKGEYRVLRGGSWGAFEYVLDARSTVRFGYVPSDHDFSIGFRCVRDVP